MSTPESAAAPPPLTAEEALQGQRRELAGVLRRLADLCEAGKLPKFIGGWTEICPDCADEHPRSISFTEDRATVAYLALIGLSDMVDDAIRRELHQMSFQAMIDRVRANHEAAHATKQ